VGSMSTEKAVNTTNPSDSEPYSVRWQLLQSWFLPVSSPSTGQEVGIGMPLSPKAESIWQSWKHGWRWHRLHLP
jgi:hypothetical protein